MIITRQKKKPIYDPDQDLKDLFTKPIRLNLNNKWKRDKKTLSLKGGKKTKKRTKKTKKEKNNTIYIYF